MELALADLSCIPALQSGAGELQPSLAGRKPAIARLPRRVDDVIITPEFDRRKPRPANPASELVALKHLARFMTADPAVVHQELATILAQVCRAGSAGITLEERRRASGTLQTMAVAGQLAGKLPEWEPRESPAGAVIDRNRPEVFVRPEEFYPALQPELPIEELLVIPWQLSSGRRGAIWLAMHRPDMRFDPEDVRLISTLSDFARLALERSHSEETRRSCETLASAARLANQLAHEVNNPLQALINSLYLVPPQSEQAHIVDARFQADRLVGLVRSVLEIKRQDGAVLITSVQQHAHV